MRYFFISLPKVFLLFVFIFVFRGISWSQTISEGVHHSLFLCQSNNAMSCGWSDFGQLGNSNSYPWPIPSFQILGPNSVTSVACGDWHSLFLKSDSTVVACGLNDLFALGNGSSDWMKTTPVSVSGLTEIVAIAAGGDYSLFLKNDSTVWACGYNSNGQLGDGTNYLRAVPFQIPGLNNVIAIAAASASSYFVKSDGTVWACGFNLYGQLGDSTTTDRLIPVQVLGLTDVIAVATSGLHTLFLKSNGTVWGCGGNSSGQLGLGFGGIVIAPVEIPMLGGVIGIAAGTAHSVFLKNDSTAWACGYNGNGAIGNNTTLDHPTPVQVLSNVVNVAAGYSSSLFVKSDGTVLCCGENKYGLTGDAVTTNSLVPLQASGLTNIVYAFAGKTFHSLFVRSDGSAWGFGNNQYGQLGGFTNPLQVNAVPVSGLTNTKAVSAGQGHSLFLKNDSTVWAIGSNYNGELGDSTGIDKPDHLIHVPGLTSIVAISASRNHSIFLKSDSTVWTCGYNSTGALGDGTNTNRLYPVQVQGLTGIKAISAGAFYSLFLKGDGTVWACGQNGGNFGDGNTTNSNVPVQAIGVTDVIAISAGSDHSLFLKSDGTVLASGQNYAGQFGNGTTTSSTLAIPVSIDSATSIASAPGFSLFLRANGTVWACGSNSSGQLGDSTLFNYTSTIIQIPGLSDVVEIAANSSSSLFAKSDGSVWGCGTNSYGQLGDSSLIQRNSVVEVKNLCYSATEVEEHERQTAALMAHPNPTSGEVTITSQTVETIKSAAVYNYEGRLIQSIVVKGGAQFNINLSELPSGIYIVACSGQQGLSFVKILKE